MWIPQLLTALIRDEASKVMIDLASHFHRVSSSLVLHVESVPFGEERTSVELSERRGGRR